MKKIKVAVAEDHTPYRVGLGGLLEEQPDMELVGLATNGTELLQILKQEPADVVLMDIEMPMQSGIEVTRRISDQWPETRVIGLTIILPMNMCTR
ncbi:MAG: response regulator [Flavisolibacter sp.]